MRRRRQVPVETVVESDAACGDELHHERRGERLRNRPEREARLRVDLKIFRRVAKTVPAFENVLALVSDRDGTSGDVLAGELGAHERVDAVGEIGRQRRREQQGECGEHATAPCRRR